MKRVLVTGGSGLLGSNLIPVISGRYEVIATYREAPLPGVSEQFKLDISGGREEIFKAFESARPDCVIHCAALAKVDYCQEHPEEARLVNALAVRDMVSLLPVPVRFIYISTDSLFDGGRGNYSEEDDPSPLNEYARSKLQGEGFVKERDGNSVILRTNFFGWNRVKGTSLAEWIIQSLKNNIRINMFTDVIFSPLSAVTLAGYIGRLIESDFRGTLNIASQDHLNKYEFGSRIAELFGLDKGLINPMSVEGFSYKARRPKNTVLDVTKAKGIFGSMPFIEDELKLFYQNREAGYAYKDR